MADILDLIGAILSIIVSIILIIAIFRTGGIIDDILKSLAKVFLVNIQCTKFF